MAGDFGSELRRAQSITADPSGGQAWEEPHTVPLNLETAGGWEVGGGGDEQTFTQDLSRGFWVSNPLLLVSCQLLPCREHERFLQVGQGYVYQFVANYMVNTIPLVEAVTEPLC